MSTLTAESFKEYNSARQRAFMEEWLSAFTGRSSDLLSFEEVRQSLQLRDSTYKGLQEIELDKIVGSTGRYRDFTRTFLPKNGITEERWRKVDAAVHDHGLPPIEVYQIGEVYFVRDGNHRVSIARIHEADTIEAYVIEYKTPVSVDKEDDMDVILLKAEKSKFLKETKIDQLRPDQDIVFTEPGRYRSVIEHIAFHKYLKACELNREISWEEAVTGWYDTVYMPIIRQIRDKQVLKQFPGRTEADLYAWLILHRANLEEEMEALGYIPDEAVLEEIKTESPNPIVRLIGYFNHRLNLQNMPLKVEHARFLNDTKLDETRPNHNLSFSDVSGYRLAREHIVVHKYLQETEQNRQISIEVAASSWYDTVYLPIIKLVREREVADYFPDNTEADLYIWLVSRRAALEKERHEMMGHQPDEELLADLEQLGRAGSWSRWLPLFRQKLDIQDLLPD